MSPFELSQLIIGIAFIADMASFQFKQQRHVLMCLAVAACLIGAHFLVLQVYTAAVLGFLAAARFGFGAARVKVTPRRRVDGIGNIAC